jgi:hypothetical protein
VQRFGGVERGVPRVVAVEAEVEHTVRVLPGQDARGMHGQGGLAHTRHAYDHADPRGVALVPDEQAEFLVTPDELRRLRREGIQVRRPGRESIRARYPGGQPGGRPSGKPGIAPEDPLMQFGEHRPGFCALLFDQVAARLPVEAEGVTWPAAAIQGGHLVSDEGLVQRILSAQMMQFADQVRVPPERQVTLDAFQDGRPALLLEAVTHPRDPVAVDAGQGRTAPQPVCFAQQGGRPVMVLPGSQPVRPPPQLAELMQVHLFWIDVEEIAAGTPGKLHLVADRLTERCAEPGKVSGKAFPGLGRWAGVPQPVDERLCRDDRARR